MTATSRASRKRPERLQDLAVQAFTAFPAGVSEAELRAQLLTGDEPPPLQKLGTLGLTNANGQQVAVGALDEWLSKNRRVPMFAQHNTRLLPAGSWRDFELVSGTDLWARPYVTAETSMGRDILASVESGDVRGISWTVYPRDFDSYRYRPAEKGERGDWLSEVLVITQGILREVSVVDAPADKTARFRSRKFGSTTGKATTIARQMYAQAMAARALVRK